MTTVILVHDSPPLVPGPEQPDCDGTQTPNPPRSGPGSLFSSHSWIHRPSPLLTAGSLWCSTTDVWPKDMNPLKPQSPNLAGVFPWSTSAAAPVDVVAIRECECREAVCIASHNICGSLVGVWIFTRTAASCVFPDSLVAPPWWTLFISSVNFIAAPWLVNGLRLALKVWGRYTLHSSLVMVHNFLPPRCFAETRLRWGGILQRRGAVKCVVSHWGHH